MPRKATGVAEQKPVYAIPERLWKIEDVMHFMGIERETAYTLLKEHGAPHFQHNRVYYIHPVAFELWIEKKLKENGHGPTQEGSQATTP